MIYIVKGSRDSKLYPCHKQVQNTMKRINKIQVFERIVLNTEKNGYSKNTEVVMEKHNRTYWGLEAASVTHQISAALLLQLAV